MKRSEWADLCWERAKGDLDHARLLEAHGLYEQCIYICWYTVEKAIWSLGTIDREQAMSESPTVEEIATELGAPSDTLEYLSTAAKEFAEIEYPNSESIASLSRYAADDAADRMKRTEEVLAWVESRRAS